MTPRHGSVCRNYANSAREDFDNWVIEPHDYKALARNIGRYIKTRERQILKYPIDINKLIQPFMNYLTQK